MLILIQSRFGVESEDREYPPPNKHWGGGRFKPLGLSLETMSRSPNPCGSIPSVIILTDSPGKVLLGLGQVHWSTGTRVGMVGGQN